MLAFPRCLFPPPRRHGGLVSCGLSEQERVNTYQIVSALIQLGQVKLEADGEGCMIASDTTSDIAKCCELLGSPMRGHSRVPCRS